VTNLDAKTHKAGIMLCAFYYGAVSGGLGADSAESILDIKIEFFSLSFLIPKLVSRPYLSGITRRHVRLPPWFVVAKLKNF
jgi:hypothetical protein